MILDTSALAAAITGEADSQRFQHAMLGAASLAISAMTVLETRIVLQSRHGAEVVQAFDEMLDQAGIVVVPFDAESAQVAFDAFRRYGKGQGRKAQLTVVDCAAYALTDVESALQSTPPEVAVRLHMLVQNAEDDHALGPVRQSADGVIQAMRGGPPPLRRQLKMKQADVGPDLGSVDGAWPMRVFRHHRHAAIDDRRIGGELAWTESDRRFRQDRRDVTVGKRGQLVVHCSRGVRDPK